MPAFSYMGETMKKKQQRGLENGKGVDGHNQCITEHI
jgi:hypothetical protein